MSILVRVFLCICGRIFVAANLGVERLSHGVSASLILLDIAELFYRKFGLIYTPSNAWAFPCSKSLPTLGIVRWLGIKWHFFLVLLCFIWFLASLCIFLLCLFSPMSACRVLWDRGDKVYGWTNLELSAVSLWSMQVRPGSLGLKRGHPTNHTATCRGVFLTS